jgi:cellulose synthase/poly-beta-1,6-N-acetylglucosamine synthase-like glycosyltransferase
MKQDLPLVSIVIPAYNEGPVLKDVVVRSRQAQRSYG